MYFIVSYTGVCSVWFELKLLSLDGVGFNTVVFNTDLSCEYLENWSGYDELLFKNEIIETRKKTVELILAAYPFCSSNANYV